MSLFELHLNFHPAFHRSCSVRITGDVEGDVLVKASAVGVLPAVEYSLSVDSDRLAELRAACLTMLQQWDPAWSQWGLDGISVLGSFDWSGQRQTSFELWSPRPGSVPHAMLAAAFQCLPPEKCGGVVGEILEDVRSYLRLQPALTLMDEQPLRLRVAPSLAEQPVSAVEASIAGVPEGVALVVDISALQPPFGRPSRLDALKPLLKRDPPAQWLVSERLRDAIIKLGADPCHVQCTSRLDITRSGLPVILGGFVVTQQVLDVARNGSRMDLVKVLHVGGLPVTHAARGAAELMEILARASAEAS